jgi:DUF4097 and DUF4098 domain-containing protein YvlB
MRVPTELRLALAASLTSCVAFSAGCSDILGADLGRYVDREDKHFSTTSQPVVALATFDGPIEIRPWDKPEVQVTIEKRGPDKSSVSAIEVHAEQTGDKVSVDVTAPKRSIGIMFGFSRSAKLIVSVPVSADVSARSGDGSIDIERISGRLELRSGDGSIRARGLSGDVTVQTGDGSITLGGTFTGLHARTGDGSVTIRIASGAAASSAWDISTGDGSVTLELPDGFGAELDAHTGDGGIHLNDLTLSDVTGQLGRNTVRGRLGSGGPSVKVRTGDGSITLRRS